MPSLQLTFANVNADSHAQSLDPLERQLLEVCADFVGQSLSTVLINQQHTCDLGRSQSAQQRADVLLNFAKSVTVSSFSFISFSSSC